MKLSLYKIKVVQTSCFVFSFVQWSQLRSEINIWWNTKLTEGQRTFVPICAINVLVRPACNMISNVLPLYGSY